MFLVEFQYFGVKIMLYENMNDGMGQVNIYSLGGPSLDYSNLGEIGRKYKILNMSAGLSYD